jgi:integrase
MPHCGQKIIFIASRTLENQVSNRCEESENPTPVVSKRTPWNKGKLTGAKPPLRPKHVWSIRTKLQMADRKRDLALFNLAIDSKLRGCDVIGLKVEDIAPNGYAIERATIRQKKTGRSVRFEITEQTRQAVDDYLRVANRKRGDFLFAAQRQADRGLSTRQYARLVGDWIRGIGLDPCLFGTVRHAFPAADQGHHDLSPHRQSAGRPVAPWPYQDREHVRYLGIEVDDALAIAEQIDV